MSVFEHPLSEVDRLSMVDMRQRLATLKGKITGPDSRPVFDGIWEKIPSAPDVSYDTDCLGGVPGCWCHPRGASSNVVILYFHGGAYNCGTANAYRNFAGQLAHAARASAFVVDYALAPEAPFPKAVEDAVAVWRAMSERGLTRVAIVGDSAGGGLALVLAGHPSARNASDRPAARCVVALSPWTDLAFSGKSLASRKDTDPILTLEALSGNAHRYLCDHDPHDPMCSPLYALSGNLPPALIHVGDCEILLDDSLRVAQREQAAGKEIECHVWSGMPHVFLSNLATMEAAQLALASVGSFVRARL